MGWESLIPLALSAGRAIIGSKSKNNQGTVTSQTNMPDWQMALGENLSGWVQKYLNSYQPGVSYGGVYPGKIPTSYEQSGLGILRNLLDQPAMGELYGAAKGQLLDTLSGKYADPSVSPFIKAMTTLSKQWVSEAIDAARRQAGSRGGFFTRSAINTEGDIRTKAQNYLDSIVGDFMNTERGRMLQAEPLAQSLEGFGTDTAIKKATASQTLGSLPRLLEEADFQRQYNDWINQRGELKAIPGVGQSIFGTNVPTITQGTGSNSMGDIAPWISLAMMMMNK